ncbi:uncharacterized protein CCR75_003425 [Bremia lactucae]|uniref:GH18 domain-containing protein n=1 Tax=Bremia lactucae TaxID=4779 RepID=A0A976NY98_BRELC|nr:hypothetical protein CCR75_003425 [Bremia lactucae]
MYTALGLVASTLTQEEQNRLNKCPCTSDFGSKSLCLPVDFSIEKPRKEVFAFSITTENKWKNYDWDTVTTVAWNEDKKLLCHAHSKGVKVVVKHNFDDTSQLCNASARQEWIKATYEKNVDNYADGVNIDTEKPMHGITSQFLALLMLELRQELKQHALTRHAQVTFGVPWAPRGVDGRFYPWRELAAAADFLFVMSYDIRSQVYDEFLLGYDIPPSKLVLGVPWYGYRYPCLQGQLSAATIDDASWCQIQPAPFFGAPCSDAAGTQVNYGNVRRLMKSQGLIEQWDPTTLSPFVWYSSPEGGRSQIWFDNLRSLEAKHALMRELGLRGVGMWHADALDYSLANDSQVMWRWLADAFRS